MEFEPQPLQFIWQGRTEGIAVGGERGARAIEMGNAD